MEYFLWHGLQGRSISIENVTEFGDGTVEGTVHEPVPDLYGQRIEARAVSVGRWDPEHPDVVGWIDRPVPAPAPAADPEHAPIPEEEEVIAPALHLSPKVTLTYLEGEETIHAPEPAAPVDKDAIPEPVPVVLAETEAPPPPSEKELDKNSDPPALYDPNELTVEQLEGMLGDITSLEDLGMLRSAEVGGKNRKTALEAIDERIADREDELTAPDPDRFDDTTR